MNEDTLFGLGVGIVIGWVAALVYREMTKGVKCPVAKCHHRSASQTLTPIDVHPHAETQWQWQEDPNSAWYRKPIFPMRADGSVDMTSVMHTDGTSTFGEDSKCAQGCVVCGTPSKT